MAAPKPAGHFSFRNVKNRFGASSRNAKPRFGVSFRNAENDYSTIRKTPPFRAAFFLRDYDRSTIALRAGVLDTPVKLIDGFFHFIGPIDLYRRKDDLELFHAMGAENV